jgi:hypothetical protein
MFLSTRGLQVRSRALLGLLIFIYGTTFLILVRRVIRKNKNKELPKFRNVLANANNVLQAKLFIFSTKKIMFILLLLSTILAVVVTAIISPNMGVRSNRYFFNLMPLIFLLGIMIIFAILSRYKPAVKKFNLVAPTLLIITLSSHLILNTTYTFPDNENRGQLNKEIQGAVCLLISAEDYLIHNFSDVFFTADKVFAAREVLDPSINIAFSALDDKQKVTVIIDNRIPQIPEELLLLENQTGYPLQFLYKARHGTFLYRAYSLINNP